MAQARGTPGEGWTDELNEWLDALDSVLRERGPERAKELLEQGGGMSSGAGRRV